MNETASQTLPRYRAVCDCTLRRFERAAHRAVMRDSVFRHFARDASGFNGEAKRQTALVSLRRVIRNRSN